MSKELKQITVTTGFGYVKDKQGKIVSKSILRPGVHNMKAKYDYVEVADAQALNAIQVEPVPDPPEVAKRKQDKQNAIAKLVALGLTEDEARAI